MTNTGKGKKTAKKTTKGRVTKGRVPNKKVEDSKVEDEDEAEDEGFKAKAKSSSRAGTEEIEVEVLVDGIVTVFGEGLGTVVDKSATVGVGLLSDVQSAARSVVSATMGGVIKACRIVDDAVGAKNPGFRDKG
jgi:hypothetical protein